MSRARHPRPTRRRVLAGAVAAAAALAGCAPSTQDTPATDGEVVTAPEPTGSPSTSAASPASAPPNGCPDGAEPADLDGDGTDDRFAVDAGGRAIACVGDTTAAFAAGPVEAVVLPDLDGDGDVEPLVGGTTVSAMTVQALDWRDGELRTIDSVDGGGPLHLQQGVAMEVTGDEARWRALWDWGCTDGPDGRQVHLVAAVRTVDPTTADVTVTTVEVRDGGYRVVSETTERQPTRGESMASDVLLDLGSRTALTQRALEGCLPA